MHVKDSTGWRGAEPSRLIVPGTDIVTASPFERLVACYAVARWRTAAEYRAGAPPYLSTRDGARTLGRGTVTNEGGAHLWKALIDGISGTELFSEANTILVVSDVTGAPAYSDSVVADELDRENMDSTFPLQPGETSGTATAGDREAVFRSTYGATSANGDWRRFWVLVNTGGGDLILDNFASSQGTKASGQVWQLTVTLRFE